MKIGFMLPMIIATDGRGNGIRAGAEYQVAALRRAGHEVVCLEPWAHDAAVVRQLDVVHYLLGAFAFFGIEHQRPDPARMLVFAPVIDSNEPNWRYRMAARLGTSFPRLFTIPGELRRQAVNSDLVLCRSTHERERVIHGLGVDPARVPVEVVPHGIDPPGDADPEGVRRRLNLPKEFMLHVSRYAEERKNVVRLIEAVGPTGLPLVIAGTPAPGRNYERIKDLARRHPAVTLLGFQDRQTLQSLYAACKVFCLPTLNEGVGLVGLEAATYGAAVVVTKVGGPPDYFRDLAEYVDPFDVADIRRAVVAAWAKPPTTALRDHVVSNLTWDHTARGFVAAYQKHKPAGRG